MNFVLIGGIAVCVWAVLLTLSGERMRQFQTMQAKLRAETMLAADPTAAAKTGAGVPSAGKGILTAQSPAR